MEEKSDVAFMNVNPLPSTPIQSTSISASPSTSGLHAISTTKAKQSNP